MVLPDFAAPLPHGGDLGVARRLFPAAPEPFVDLSTGINPYSYPLPPLDHAAFARLPAPAALERLAAAAAAAYGAPSAAHVAAGAGAQSLLPHVAALAGADLAVVVNPNNPDGRLIAPPDLRALADALAPGLLVVDEAFMDAAPAAASVGADVARANLVVLRSFGKFFGLAGLRLGFALAAPAIAARLRATLGPWPVSGPAVVIGTAALADVDWIAATRARLVAAVQRLDDLLVAAGLDIVGGTALFRLVRTADADEVFDRLGHAGILVRRFANEPAWLRFGLPGAEAEWQRLGEALAPHRPPAPNGKRK